ncbi:hypothetical protein BC940DRAFT_338333 [Gongronella butleri]|nr:hypothetical protein BC940DRAFT_338333 [Gongronella butleri]
MDTDLFLEIMGDEYRYKKTLSWYGMTPSTSYLLQDSGDPKHTSKKSQAWYETPARGVHELWECVEECWDSEELH